MLLTDHQSLGTKFLTIHTDGGSRGNPGPAATGVVILDDSGKLIHQFGRFIGVATNNDAEYWAVIDALEWVITTWLSRYPAISLNFRLDSKLVVEQVSGHWKVKSPTLLILKSKILSLIQEHQLDVDFRYIPRDQNSAADRQVNLSLDA